MYLNSLFLVMQFIAVGVRNGLVQGLDIAGYQVPDQCTAICTPAAALYNSCTAISCLCTAGSEMEVQECVNCVIPIEPSLVSILEPLGAGKPSPFNFILGTGLTTSLGASDFNVLCGGNLPPLTLPPTTVTAVIPPTVTLSSTTSLPISLPVASSGTTGTDTVMSPAATSVSITETTVPPSTTSQVIPSTTTAASPSASGTGVGSSTSAVVVPLPTNSVNGAELSVQSQLRSMGIAIGISLLLRVL